MTGDPLYQPLGIGGPPVPSARRRLVWVLPVGIAAVAVAATAYLVRHAGRDEPDIAVATIRTAPPAAPAPAAASAPPAETPVEVVPAPAPPATGNSTVVVENGVKVIRFNPQSTASGMVAVPVPSDAPLPAGSDPLTPAPDARISENAAGGVLPRIGKGGLKAAVVYARPVEAVRGPRLSVVVTGVGTDQLATADAARRLPGAVTFAFSPTAPDVATQVAETRHAGHEVMLVLPPGAGEGASPAEARSALHRPMAAFPGYVGLVAAPGNLAAAEAEGASRGLMVLGPADHGAASQPPRIDVDPAATKDAVGAAIAQGADEARRTGSALIVLDARGLAPEDLARRLTALGSDQVTLVPASAAWGARSQTATQDPQ